MPKTTRDRITLIILAVLLLVTLCVLIVGLIRHDRNPEELPIHTPAPVAPTTRVITKEVEKFIEVEKTITSEILQDGLNDMGLKKVIAACYREQELDLFSTDDCESGCYCEYEGGVVSFEDIEVKHFKGNGDFRSAESIELLKQSDIVVTNPPFSLFREFVAQLVKYNKKYLIIGNVNAITYKDIFELIQADKAWLGVNLGRGISGFIVPEHYELYGTEASIDKKETGLWLQTIACG